MFFLEGSFFAWQAVLVRYEAQECTACQLQHCVIFLLLVFFWSGSLGLRVASEENLGGGYIFLEFEAFLLLLVENKAWHKGILSEEWAIYLSSTDDWLDWPC